MTRKPLVPDPELWDAVKAEIKPLARRKKAASADVKLPPKKSLAPIVKKPKPALLAQSAMPKPELPKKQNPSPPLTGLDRRTSQKLTRGKVEIEARLDLHGHTVELARVELRRFLADCRQQGLRTVLVITGKGESPFSRHTLHSKDAWHAPERAGRIRRSVTDWFEEAEFRSHISGFQPAHPRHGGGGAFYVRLRRNDRGRA